MNDSLPCLAGSAKHKCLCTEQLSQFTRTCIQKLWNKVFKLNITMQMVVIIGMKGLLYHDGKVWCFFPCDKITEEFHLEQDGFTKCSYAFSHILSSHMP